MNPRPLRVLVLGHTAQLGGAELALLRLCAALGPDVRVRVVLFADGELRDRLTDLGVGVEVLPLDPTLATMDRAAAARLGVRQLPQMATFLWRLTRLVHAVRPDVVHTTSLKSDLLGTLAALGARRPLVWYMHDRISPDYLPGPMVRLVRWAARLPTAVIANSRATAATLPVSTTLAYPGFSADQVAVRESAPTGTVVGMVGRISPTKGQLELVRAASAVLDHHPHATFRVVGTPMFGAEDYAAQVREEAQRLGVAEAFTWVGFTRDVAAELDRCSVVVHASPVPEPFGQVVVEAMVRGVPVVATRAGGVTEIVEPGGEPLGVLVAPGDAAALAEGIVSVLDRPDAAAVRAGRARASALERFDVARTAEVVSEVWRRACGR